MKIVTIHVRIKRIRDFVFCLARVGLSVALGFLPLSTTAYATSCQGNSPWPFCGNDAANCNAPGFQGCEVAGGGPGTCVPVGSDACGCIAGCNAVGCPNSVCDPGENCWNCSNDCGCSSGEICDGLSQSCVPAQSTTTQDSTTTVALFSTTTVALFSTTTVSLFSTTTTLSFSTTTALSFSTTTTLAFSTTTTFGPFSTTTTLDSTTTSLLFSTTTAAASTTTSLLFSTTTQQSSTTTAAASTTTSLLASTTTTLASTTTVSLLSTTTTLASTTTVALLSTTTVGATTTVMPNPCGAVGTICGAVTALETGTNLRNIPLELRSSAGIVQRSGTSNTVASGNNYGFSGLPAGKYFVSPALGRNQSSTPLRSPADLVNNSSVNAPFAIRGVPATVQVNGVPGSFVLITPTAWPAATNPPPTSTAQTAWSSTIGLDGKASINVPSGSYWFTCWAPKNCGDQVKYLRTANGQINGGTAVAPQQSPSSTPALPPVTCPTTDTIPCP